MPHGMRLFDMMDNLPCHDKHKTMLTYDIFYRVWLFCISNRDVQANLNYINLYKIIYGVAYLSHVINTRTWLSSLKALGVFLIE